MNLFALLYTVAVVTACVWLGCIAAAVGQLGFVPVLGFIACWTTQRLVDGSMP